MINKRQLTLTFFKTSLLCLTLIIVSLIAKSAHCATFALGNFPGSASFGNADGSANNPSQYNLLPTHGLFSDTWPFNVGSNAGGESNLTIDGIRQTNINNLTASLTGDNINYHFSPLFSNRINQLLGLSFNALPAGAYLLSINGTINASEPYHSYSGNLVIQPSNTPSPVPVPGAVWLFGSALLGLSQITKRKAIARVVLASAALTGTATAGTLYSDCPAGNCTVYQSYGSATVPSKPLAPPAVVSNCGVSSTTYYVQVPATYTIDALGVHLSIPRIKDTAGELSDNNVLLGSNGKWSVERLNGINLQ